jgi:hypothetical protein
MDFSVILRYLNYFTAYGKLQTPRLVIPSSSVAQSDVWSANLDILSLQRKHLSFPSLLSLILESEIKVDLEQVASFPSLLIVLCDNNAFA